MTPESQIYLRKNFWDLLLFLSLAVLLKTPQQRGCSYFIGENVSLWEALNISTNLL